MSGCCEASVGFPDRSAVSVGRRLFRTFSSTAPGASSRVLLRDRRMEGCLAASVIQGKWTEVKHLWCCGVHGLVSRQDRNILHVCVIMFLFCKPLQRIGHCPYVRRMKVEGSPRRRGGQKGREN